MPLSEIRLTPDGPRTQALYEFLRNAILEGRLLPNERLTEQAIAGMASVSRTPVREALQKLAVEGLVQDTGRGFVVGAVSPSELSDLCEVREALEGLATRLAAVSRSEMELVALRRILDDFRAAAERNETGALVGLNHAFHDTIWQIARNRYLADLLTNLRIHIERLQPSTLAIPGRPQEVLEEHERMYDAIARRDQGAADHAARGHFLKAMALRITHHSKPSP